MNNIRTDLIAVLIITFSFFVIAILFPGELVGYVDPDASFFDVLLCYSIAFLFISSYFLEEKSRVFKSVISVCKLIMWPESKKWAIVIFAVFFWLGTDYIVRIIGY